MTLTLNDALLDYYSVRSGRYSLSTWRAHEQRLEMMRTWLTKRTQPNVYLADLDDRLLADYFKTLRPPRYAASSYNNFRQYAKMFFGFCVAEGWISTDPTRHVDPIKPPKRIRLQLTPSEMLAALETATPRDRIGLAVGMNTGLRARDATGLTIGSVMLDTGFLSVWIEKTDTEDQLPISSEFRTEILAWFEHLAGVMGVASISDLPNEWHLIPPAHWLASDVNDPSGPGRLTYHPDRQLRHPEQIVHRALTRLGHPTKGEGFHTLRRSMARALYDLAVSDNTGKSAPIRVAQAQLGHKNQATTEHYLGLEGEKQARNELLRGKSFLTRAAGVHRDIIEQERAALEKLRAI